MNEKEALLTFMDVHRAVDVPLLSSNDIAGTFLRGSHFSGVTISAIGDANSFFIVVVSAQVGVGSSRGMAATVNHGQLPYVYQCLIPSLGLIFGWSLLLSLEMLISLSPSLFQLKLESCPAVGWLAK